MEISNRLKAICDLCLPGQVVADIGCDHGYVSITLTNSGKFEKALAMDINEGPLRLAGQNIALYGDKARIETRLSSGFDKLEKDEADTVIIAGMGGMLVRDILDAGRDKLGSVGQLVLGAQSDIDTVRRYITEAGFRIDDEEMLEEDGKYYQLIRAVNDGSDNVGKLNDIEALYGPVLIKKKHAVLREYLTKQKAVLTDIKLKLDGRTEDKIISRVEELTRDIRIIDETLELIRES